MTKRQRDFRAEYVRRIAKAQALGLSRSQARGHAKASEKALRKTTKPLSDERIQLALSALRQERSIARAAKAAKISPERLRKFAIEKDIIEKVAWLSFEVLSPTLLRGRELGFVRGRAPALWRSGGRIQP